MDVLIYFQPHCLSLFVAEWRGRGWQRGTVRVGERPVKTTSSDTELYLRILLTLGVGTRHNHSGVRGHRNPLAPQLTGGAYRLHRKLTAESEEEN